MDAWNEAVSAQSFAANLHRRLFLRLAREKGDSGLTAASFEPELATSWTVAEDRRSLTFHLREATWSDGAPLTAEDVRFTWQAQTHADVAWVGADSKADVKDVTVGDPRTVTFHFDRVTPFQFAHAVEGGILPATSSARCLSRSGARTTGRRSRSPRGPSSCSRMRPARRSSWCATPRRPSRRRSWTRS